MKVHYRVPPPAHEPDWYIEEKRTKGHESACGYLRKNTSWSISKVTCYYCLVKYERDLL